MNLAAARIAFTGLDEEARRAAIATLDVDPHGAEAAPAIAFLVEAMGDTGWRVRKEAAARLASWPDRQTAARALTQALAEPDNVGRRNAAIEALVLIGPQAVEPLKAALAKGGEHRKVLVDTLGLLADPAGAQAVQPLLHDPEPNVRVAAAEALGAIGGAEAQAALRRVLVERRGELLLTLAVLDALNQVGARLPAGELEPLLSQPTLRAAALGALGRSGDVQALSPLERALTDGARSVRESATLGLAELYERLDEPARRSVEAQLQECGEATVHALVQALLEGNSAVQVAAALVLGLTRRPEAVRPLALALGDPELRDVAIEGLIAVGSKGVEALVALAPDLEERLRADVYALLPRFGASVADPKVLALLEEAIEDEDPDAAAGAAAALGELGLKDALPVLLRALGREEPVGSVAAAALGRLGQRHYDEVRILVSSRGLSGPEAPQLCRVLAACGRAGDAPFLKQALGAESPAVRRAAAEALGQLDFSGERRGGAEVAEALLFALTDEASQVRAAAARALGAHAEWAASGPAQAEGEAAPLGAAAPVSLVQALERAAQDPDAAVRASAARALGALGRALVPRTRATPSDEAQAALAVLRRLRAAPEAILAVPALEVLGAIGDASDDPALYGALDSVDPEIVKAAARGLGHRRSGPAAVEARRALERTLGDRRWDVRRAAALALGAHGTIAHPLLYARRLVEDDPLVLEALDEAMVASLSPDDEPGPT